MLKKKLANKKLQLCKNDAKGCFASKIICLICPTLKLYLAGIKYYKPFTLSDLVKKVRSLSACMPRPRCCLKQLAERGALYMESWLFTVLG